MAKLDLKKELKHLYNPSAKAISEVDVPAMNFLMIDGHGDPNTAPAFQESVKALYALAFAVKFASKNSTAGIDYTVMPSEGLWWMDDMGTRYGDFDFTADKSRWKWTMMIMQPDHITREMVDATIADLQGKKNLPAVDRVRFEPLDEGRTVQIMHLGSYDDEKPTIDRLHSYIAEHGFEAMGGQAPRNLSQRSESNATGKAAHGDPPADSMTVRFILTGVSPKCLTMAKLHTL